MGESYVGCVGTPPLAGTETRPHTSWGRVRALWSCAANFKQLQTVYQDLYSDILNYWQDQGNFMVNASLAGGAGMGFGVQINCGQQVVLSIGGGSGTGFNGMYGNLTAGGGGGAGMQGGHAAPPMPYGALPVLLVTNKRRASQRTALTVRCCSTLAVVRERCGGVCLLAVVAPSVAWWRRRSLLVGLPWCRNGYTGGGGGLHMVGPTIVLPNWGTATDQGQVRRCCPLRLCLPVPAWALVCQQRQVF